MVFPRIFSEHENITFAGDYCKTDNSISECHTKMFENSKTYINLDIMSLYNPKSQKIKKKEVLYLILEHIK